MNLNGEENYLNALKYILDNGFIKSNRTGTDAITSHPMTLQHDMSLGFPLLTTKKMWIRSISAELEFFIKGLTDKQWLNDRKCTIWNEWCSPVKVPSDLTEEDRKEFQLCENELGPIYGYQWRNFNKPYFHKEYEYLYDVYHKGNVAGEDLKIQEVVDILQVPEYKIVTAAVENSKIGEYSFSRIKIEKTSGVDQLADLVNTLKNDPGNRRMIVTAWNPSQLSEMALPPCHMTWGVQVVNNKLNLWWLQRSCDFGAGIPYNMASYAILLKLLAAESGYQEGILTGFLADCHIYEDHVEQMREQITRKPYKMPLLKINNFKSIFDWKYTDLELVNYKSHEKLKLPIAV